MINIKRVAPGEKPSAQTINQIIDALNQLSKINVGAGLTLNKSAAGIAIGLTQQSSKAVPSKSSETDPGGTPKVLNYKIGQDNSATWERDVDQCPAKVTFETDWHYQASDGKILKLYLVLETDGLGRIKKISCEPAIVDTTASNCT